MNRRDILRAARSGRDGSASRSAAIGLSLARGCLLLALTGLVLAILL